MSTPMMTLLILLVLFAGSPTRACKGKASAAAGATSKQDNNNRAETETTINMGGTALLGDYHEQTVIMSTIVIFVSAILCWICYFFIKRHGICRKPATGPQRGWGNMSFRTLRSRLDAEEGAGGASVPNRCQNLDRAGHGK